jgi:hypothetical protein
MQDIKDINKITIDIEELLNVDDNSISDYETIRQIGLLSCTVNDVSDVVKKQLYKKVKSEFQVYGLYPRIMTSFNIKPDKKSDS